MRRILSQLQEAVADDLVGTSYLNGVYMGVLLAGRSPDTDNFSDVDDYDELLNGIVDDLLGSADEEQSDVLVALRSDLGLDGK